MQTASQKVIVVGGGLAGLVAATYAARAGFKVSLYEKAAELGGRAATRQEGDVLFNLGPHALYSGGWGERVLQELGVTYTGKSPKLAGWAVRNNNIYALPATPGSLLKTGLLSFGAKMEVMGFFGGIAGIKPSEFANLTVRQWVEKRFKSQSARELFTALARLITYQNAPDSGSAEQYLNSLKAGLKTGVLYLDGGWQTLVNGLAEKATEAGVEIFTGSRIEALEIAGGRITGVRLADGSLQNADAVIVAATPEIVAKLVNTPKVQGAIAATPKVEAACLDLALHSLPHPDRIFALGIDKPLYYSVHSQYAKLGPADKVVLHVAKYLPVGKKSDPVADRRELEELVDVLQPGWRTQVAEERFLPHMVVTGAAALAANRGLAGRLPVKVEGIKDLYLAGDWIGNEGWLSDASFASAHTAVQNVRQSLRQTSPALSAH